GNKRQDENQLTSDGEACLAFDNRYIKRCDLDCGPRSFEVHNEGEELLWSIASRMNKMTGKGDAGVSLPRTLVRGSQNPNSELDYTLHFNNRSYERSAFGGIDVAATFGVLLSTVGDLHKLINDIEAGKHDELLFGMTSGDRMETLDALGSICNSIQANRNNAYVIPCKVSHADNSINLNVDESTIPSDPIVQSVDINTKSTSYAGAAGVSAKEQPKVNSNFHTLVADLIFDGVNVFIPRKVFDKEQLGKTWAEKDYDEFQMLLFKFDSRAGLEAISQRIIDMHFDMGKLHDVPIQVFEEDGISLISTFIEADLVDVVTIGIPSLSGDGLPKKPSMLSMNGGHPDVTYKKRKGKSKSTNVGQFTGPSVKQNVRYEPKATTTAPKKGATYVGNTSQSSSMLKTTAREYYQEVLGASCKELFDA
nr:hypothetical protein [Tanacetum cinerariifolium]